jgi:hypothetical protein
MDIEMIVRGDEELIRGKGHEAASFFESFTKLV